MILYVVAGEMSGDKHAANTLAVVKRKLRGITIRGLGGAMLHELSSEVEDWSAESAVMGFIEVLKKFSYFRDHLKKITREIVEVRPDVLLLVDYPGFNLRLAEKVKKLSPSTKIIYYISPMVWAWHKKRLPKMALLLDQMMCIFPFERPLFSKAGLKTTFVGHPLVDEIAQIKPKRPARTPNLIGLFCGSRAAEIEKIFPTMLQCVKHWQEIHPEWDFETSGCTPALQARMKEMAREHDVDPAILNIQLDNYHSLMDRASAALVTSGTATLEAALHGLPHALVFRTTKFNFYLGRMILTIKHLGIVNIIAGHTVVTELIQDDFNPSTASDVIAWLLTPDGARDHKDRVQLALEKLGGGGAHENAANVIMSYLP